MHRVLADIDCLSVASQNTADRTRASSRASACQQHLQARLPPSSLAPPANASSGCELDVGWQQAFNPNGYSITAALPLNCSSVTWQCLGCLNTLTNLTLTGSLPDLPGSWAANNSFAALQIINISSASLAGSLPCSWASPLAFPSLKVLSFSVTQLSGTLPLDWGQRDSFVELEELHLGMTGITGGQQH